MDTKIAVLSGAPKDTARLAKSLRDRFGRVLVVRTVPGRSPVRFMFTNLPRAAGRAAKRSTVTADGEDMNLLLPQWNLRILVVDQAGDAALVDEIRAIFSRFTTVHIHLAPEPIPPASRRNAFPLPPRPVRVGRAARTWRRGDAQARLAEQADAVIVTRRCLDKDILARAAARLQPTRSNTAGYVDVIVGGQYGSEGKGKIAAHLAKEYDILVRVGGPNAGHTVPGNPPYIHHHLPSGTLHSSARLVLGPGSVINVEDLLKEVSDCGVTHGRLTIDPNAMVIEDDDIGKERETLQKSIGSTAQGVGRATIRKIERSGAKLARNIAELAPFLRPTLDVVEDAVSGGGRIMLEGTQGTGLSIHHGCYPHVTSRETTVPGCLADAGINPRLLRRVTMVIRTYPIRVGGKSGPLSQEITFGEIERRTGRDPGALVRAEVGSTTGRKRRVGEFDWDMVRRAAFLNGATDVALTFADYLSAANERAHRFEQLTPETISMVEEVERVTEAQVSLIATGPGMRGIIDRREW